MNIVIASGLTIGWWAVPTLLTLWAVYKFFAYESTGAYDLGAITTLFWLFPAFLSWIIYLLIF